MINIDETIITKAAYHHVSVDKARTFYNRKTLDCSAEGYEELLGQLLLRPFLSVTETFQFDHQVEIGFNVLYDLATSIHNGKDFVKSSIQIAQHLSSISRHPNINDGELFVAYFEDLRVGSKHYDALGIYKFESKENFLESFENGNRVDLKLKKGLSNKKPEKACLIIFSEEPFTVLLLDNARPYTEYWQQDFANVRLRSDDVNDTNNFLALTRAFVDGPGSTELVLVDQIHLLNRSTSYFEQNERFDRQGFEEQVLQKKELVDSFGRFGDEYREKHDLEVPTGFKIFSQSVKKLARRFRNVIRLDTNFHIYIHGDTDLIEQGVDTDGRRYYKLYYTNES